MAHRLEFHLQMSCLLESLLLCNFGLGFRGRESPHLGLLHLLFKHAILCFPSTSRAFPSRVAIDGASAAGQACDIVDFSPLHNNSQPWRVSRGHLLWTARSRVQFRSRPAPCHWRRYSLFRLAPSCFVSRELRLPRTVGGGTHLPLGMLWSQN